jgi:hypothetical protein
MKKTLLLLPILALLFVACSFETKEKAIEYNDDMIAIQSDVDKSLVDLINAIDTFDPVEMESARIETLDVIEDAIDKVDEMRDFDKKDDFKKEMIKLLKMYEDITENELTEVIDIVGYTEELSEADLDRYQQLFDEALTKYDEAFAEFNEWQDGFAKEWDFEVEKND